MEVVGVYPIILGLRDRRVLVVGGGAVAERKVRGLREAGARIVVVAPALTPELARWSAAGELRWEARVFAPGDATGALLVFAATGDAAVDAFVIADARAHGALVNNARDGAAGDFHTPAVHRSGSLTVTVDSAGLAPSFTRRIRDELALQFDARFARAAATLGALRERVIAVVPPERRAEVLKHFAERDIDDLAAMAPSAIEHEVERTVDTLGGAVHGDPSMLICVSRKSPLAMWQARAIMSTLARAGIASTVVTVTTTGDAVRDRPIGAVGSDGVFVKELERALREERADYAVHSAKDLPSTLASDMTLAALAKRADPRDAFCSERYASFDALPAGAVVGTSSPRRRAQLASLRSDLTFSDIRGNVETRLRKLRDGEVDAIVLACAGLERLGLTATHTVPFAADVLVPAVGQGALAVEMRAGDPRIARVGALVSDAATEIAVRAERAFLATTRGGCQAPVGAHAVYTGGRLALGAAIVAPDGSAVIRDDTTIQTDVVAEAEAAAVALAQRMLAAGGEALLADVRRPASPLAGHLFVLPRTQPRPSRIAAALREAGAEVVEARDSAAAVAALVGRSPTGLLFPSSGAVGAVAAYLNELHAERARPIVAAMGPASARAAEAAGWPPDVVAAEADVGTFVHTVTRFVLEKSS
jgi:hydroxymethylbilane synthase